MTKIKALLVEDDPLHQDNIVRILSGIEPQISLIGVCTNVHDSYSTIIREKPQLIFLDIDLDNGESGFDIIQRFDHPEFAVIFTTQHTSKNMVLRALRASAADYLTKPILEDDLKIAIQRAMIDYSKNKLFAIRSNSETPDMQIKNICISSTEGKLLIPISNIMYAESNNVYTHFFLEKPTANKSDIISSESIKFWEYTLKDSSILRIHNEFLVHTAFIKRFSKKLNGGGEVKLTNGKILPVSKSRLAELKSRISGF